MSELEQLKADLQQARRDYLDCDEGDERSLRVCADECERIFNEIEALKRKS